MYILQEGVKSVDSAYTKAFHDIGPLSATPQTGNYKDLAAWTGVSVDSPPCSKNGAAHPRFPIYLQKYNPAAMKQAYELYASGAGPDSDFSNSIFMFEGYSGKGVDAIDADSTAFAFRGDNLLVAPLINYKPANDPQMVKKASDLGNQLRDILHKGSGRSQLHAYVNYAYGDETQKELYGYEQWRQSRLHSLKDKYDPSGEFDFFAPIH